jgi:hypothetical protein
VQPTGLKPFAVGCTHPTIASSVPAFGITRLAKSRPGSKPPLAGARTVGQRTAKWVSPKNGSNWLTSWKSLEPSRSALRRSGTRAFLVGRAEVARAQTTNRPSLVLVASGCLQQPPAGNRRFWVDTRTMAHLREFGHQRAYMCLTVIRYSTGLVEAWCAPQAHIVAIYYNAVF